MQYVLTYHLYWVFLSLILLEWMLIQRSHQYRYSCKETLASLGVAIGHFVTEAMFKSVELGILLWIWHYRLFTLSLSNGWSILLLFLGVEFFHYWHHRATHRVRWLWATHAVHHSPVHFNLSAAYRLGWTSWLSGNILFFMPLVWLGFHPISVLTAVSLNLLYQFGVHTELVPKLGPLEWFLNTPSHHRVHHASNPAYLDRNYGSVLIVFDRLFGTFVEEQDSNPPRYGLTHPMSSHNPCVIALREWANLLNDLRMARGWKQRFKIAFYPPDWKPKDVQSDGLIDEQQLCTSGSSV
jgi:sterol desaturase/sphingolipid hydroxylase (fatty acid hydroxylase superfamily)